jgi:hypothetical protein
VDGAIAKKDDDEKAAPVLLLGAPRLARFRAGRWVPANGAAPKPDVVG